MRVSYPSEWSPFKLACVFKEVLRTPAEQALGVRGVWGMSNGQLGLMSTALEQARLGGPEGPRQLLPVAECRS